MAKKKDIEAVGASGAAVGIGLALRAMLGQHDIDDNAIIALGSATTSFLAGRKIKRSLGEFVHGIGSIIGSERLIAAAETVNGEDIIAMLFSRAMETPDAAAKPAIIALGAEYIGQGRSVDKFIRSATRMLVECDAEDIETLARISHKASTIATDAYVKILRYADKRGSISMFSDSAGGSTIPQGKAVVLDEIDVDRAFYLIGGNGLGRATTIYTSTKNKWAGTPGGPDAVVMPSEYILRLVRILR